MKDYEDKYGTNLKELWDNIEALEQENEKLKEALKKLRWADVNYSCIDKG